ncbi:MAG: exodeoxyribonuclease V subunit beta [Desulfococcaceae bacterium]
MNRFDIAGTPLSGTNLIEASAGTGKTFTIAALVLRLVVESAIPINRLLVVTFTEAATEELKGRIRGRLREAIAFLLAETDGDPVLRSLAESDNWPEKETALRRLRAAVRDFDEAAIFTIHGFCNRMLSECAFESGALFDTELVQSQDDLFRELAADFWRNHFYDESPAFLEHIRRKSVTGPESFLGNLGRYISYPDLHLMPEPTPPPDPGSAEADWRAAFETLAALWADHGAEAIQAVNDAVAGKNLKGTGYNKNIRARMPAAMDAYLAEGPSLSPMPDDVARFTPEWLASRTNKDKTPPAHPVFDACAAVEATRLAAVEAMDQRLTLLKVNFLAWAREEMETRKARRNVLSFDDLLVHLRNALREEGKLDGGPALAERIRGRYQAALIDEFQDTDPVQYEIFHTLFGGPDHVLFLIGDPKQAIYGFRGADIFAYLHAKEKADAAYTLGRNWRSEPDLVAAVNTIFQARDRAFIFEDIPFEPVDPADRPDREILRLSEAEAAPFQIWRVAGGEWKSGKAPPKMTKGAARDALPAATAAEISRLLNLADRGEAVVDAPPKGKEETRRERPLAPGDIAVLVRTNREAGHVQRALFALGIPAVLHGTGDIFDTPEAEELGRVMAAVASPRNERRIRSALATDMMGVDGAGLETLRTDETSWESWLDRFNAWRQLWRRSGFIRMFRALAREKGVLPRLMELPDGERRCTNLLHLSELVHHAGNSAGLDMAGLVKWLDEQRRNTGRRVEEHPLRLESDADAVKLVTIHKSKGLEYPVVFCPFAWEGSQPRDPILYHGDGREVFIDLGSPEKADHEIQAGRETLAENLRLLYVALTRARHRCYFVWGKLNEAGTSAPAWLFHGADVNAEAEDLLGPLEDYFEGLEDRQLAAELDQAVKAAREVIAVQDLPKAAGIPYKAHGKAEEALTCRGFSGGISSHFRIASFSGLVRDPSASADPRDRDFAPEPPRPVPAAEHTIFTFPRGARAGTCLHAMLEKIGFAEDDRETISETVTATLRRFAYGPEWVEPLTDMVERVREVSIGPLGSPEEERFSLLSVPGTDCLVEMDFFFPLEALTPEKLAEAIRPAAGGAVPADFPDRVARLSFGEIKGFMRGFIDLVFRHNGRWYLLDWKSNHLGDSPADYGFEALQREMADHFYILQYHIYAVALDQYLRTRLPGYNYEKHFGGVAYVFLRGVDGEDGAGVFWDRPGVAVMEGLREALIAKKKENEGEQG